MDLRGGWLWDGPDQGDELLLFQESGLADAFEGLGFQECSWSWFQILSKLRGKTRARPIWRIEGKEATSCAQVPHWRVISVFPWTQLCKTSLSAIFKKIWIQYFPLLIQNTCYNSYKPSKYVEKLYHTLPKLYKNVVALVLRKWPRCTLFSRRKKKLQRIRYQQPECGHWEATKWTLPCSRSSVFVIIVFIIINIISGIFIMIISDFSM